MEPFERAVFILSSQQDGVVIYITYIKRSILGCGRDLGLTSHATICTRQLRSLMYEKEDGGKGMYLAKGDSIAITIPRLIPAISAPRFLCLCKDVIIRHGELRDIRVRIQNLKAHPTQHLHPSLPHTR